MAADSSTAVVVAVGFSVFALVIVVALAVRVGRLIRTYDALVAGDEEVSFVAAVGRQNDAIGVLRHQVGLLRDELAGVARGLAAAVQHVAVVRYDAFGDMGGLLSFSVAMLDDDGNGLVLTSINARSETRTYVKAVQGGTSEQALSPEEQEALDEASGRAAGPAHTSRPRTA